MPYFVYHIKLPTAEKLVKELTHLETFEKYKDARAMAREKRAALKRTGAISGQDVRLMFAKTQIEAEKLLSAPRDERVIGED